MSSEDKLRAFAQGIFEAANWPDGGDIDGFDLQDLAEKHGLLEPTTPLEPCGEECNCLEWGHAREDFAAGKVTCYRKTAALNGSTLAQPAEE